MTIEVTQEDIDRGVRWSSCECPIALAAIRTSKGICHVGRTVISIQAEEFQPIAIQTLPACASRFTIQFDEGEPVQPFSFNISL